jgi:hypothetical protein
VPELSTTQIWFYIDMFLPFLLPTINIRNQNIANMDQILLTSLSAFDFQNQSTQFDMFENYTTLARNSTFEFTSTKAATSIPTTLDATTLRNLIKRAIEELDESLSSSSTTTIQTEFDNSEIDLSNFFNIQTGNSSQSSANPFLGFLEAGLNKGDSELPSARIGLNEAGGMNLLNLLNSFNNVELTTASPAPAKSIQEPIMTAHLNPKDMLLGNSIPKQGSSNFDILSLVNIFQGFSGGGTSPGSIVSTITSLLGLIPIGSIIPNADNQNLAIVTSIPQILNLIQSLANFQLPDPNVIFYSIR